MKAIFLYLSVQTIITKVISDNEMPETPSIIPADSSDLPESPSTVPGDLSDSSNKSAITPESSAYTVPCDFFKDSRNIVEKSIVKAIPLLQDQAQALIEEHSSIALRSKNPFLIVLKAITELEKELRDIGENSVFTMPEKMASLRTCLSKFIARLETEQKDYLIMRVYGNQTELLNNLLYEFKKESMIIEEEEIMENLAEECIHKIKTHDFDCAWQKLRKINSSAKIYHVVRSAYDRNNINSMLTFAEGALDARETLMIYKALHLMTTIIKDGDASEIFRLIELLNEKIVDRSSTTILLRKEVQQFVFFLEDVTIEKAFEVSSVNIKEYFQFIKKIQKILTPEYKKMHKLHRSKFQSRVEIFKHKLPTPIKAMLFGYPVCLRNVVNDEYLGASDVIFNQTKQRPAFTKTIDSLTTDFFWKLRRVRDEKYSIISSHNNEILFAGEEKFLISLPHEMYDTNHRYVFTMNKNADIEKGGIWDIELDSYGMAIIKNTLYEDYLSGGFAEKYDDFRRYVLTGLFTSDILLPGKWVLTS